MIAATLARSSNEKADMLTYDAMELWLSAQKRKLKHSDYWESYEMGLDAPTNEQLAMLAVNLARKINDKPKKLVNAALEIWYEAAAKLEDDHFDAELGWLYPPNFTHEDAGRDGNIMRDAFFKKVLPASKKSRTFEIGRIGRAFIRSCFCKQFNKEPTGEETQSFYDKWNAGKKEDAEKLASFDFPEWYRQYIKEARRAAGKISASKKKLKKRL
jgi:hypothetical protein